jgi:hypothetical protein
MNYGSDEVLNRHRFEQTNLSATRIIDDSTGHNDHRHVRADSDLSKWAS